MNRRERRREEGTYGMDKNMIQLRSHYGEKYKCTVDIKYTNSSGFLVELDLRVE